MLRPLSLLLLAASLRAADTATPPLHELTYSGDQQALVALDREFVSAGRDPARLAALEKRLLAELARRDATFAARQAVAQRLGLVLAAGAPVSPANSDPYKKLAAMLVDPRDSDLARLALAPAPGAAIDSLLVNALGKAKDHARLGILDTIATRRIASAVPALAPLLRDAGAATAQAAARALGAIGNPAALTALRAAPIELTAAARLNAAAQLPAAAALAELRDLEKNPRVPAPIRHAAFRTALDRDPTAAAPAIAAALAGDDGSRKQVALEAIASSRATDLVPSLAAKLSSYDAATQAAVIAAFARRGEAAAVPSVLLATTHSDAATRAAALSALGFLPGSRDIVAALAKIVAASTSGDTTADDAKLARQSLARLAGPDVSAAILAGAEKADATLRPAYLEQIALRNLTEGIPLLLRTRNDPSAPIRLAAVAALGDIAPPSEQRAVLDWTLAATDEAEQQRALRSLVNIILRDPSTDTRGQLLFAAIEKASPEVALRLLPALTRIGGTRSADTAARLSVRDDATLAEPATTALTRWPDDTALPALATVAEIAASPASRDAARAGLLRYFERNRNPWTPEFTALVQRLLKTTSDTTERKSLLKFLHRASDQPALDLIESLKSDPTLASAATTAGEVIRANRAGPPALRASDASGNLKNILDHKTSTRWSVPTNGEEWIEIDFKVSRPLQAITLDQTTRAAEFPERYEVHVTDDAAKPGPVVVSGEGQRNKTVITFPTGTRGRYVLIKNVAARKDSQWAIVELYVD